MGLDINAYNFLKYLTRNNEVLGKTLTIGRHEDHLLNPYRWINPNTGLTEKYCEPILMHEFKASIVHSVDASNYENATFVQDLNKPWTCKELTKQKYLTILDFGTLEHVFNIPQALNSLADSCEVGGKIIHVQLHSDFCGHGFYQFSAELFHSWYSKKNGFEDVEIFIVPYTRPNLWFRCLKPKSGDRCELSGRGVPNSFILVKAIKSKEINNRVCMQSDYLDTWEKNKIINLKAPSKTFLYRIKELIPYILKSKIKAKLYKFGILLWWKSPYLIKENFKDLLKK